MSLFADYKKERENKEVLESEYGFAVYGFPQSGICYLEEIYVIPEKRSMGYAQDLAAKVEAIAKSKGCNQIIGSVSTDSKGAHYSLILMMKFGYFLGDAKENMLYMSKGL